MGIQAIMGIDIGTSNSKVGIFANDGRQLCVVSRPTEIWKDDRLGIAYYDPEKMWDSIASAIREATSRLEDATVAAVGVASMAESGLLVERSTGQPRSPLLPWFDMCSEPQAARMKRESDPFEKFRHTGLHGSYKLGMAKLLWVREHMPEAIMEGNPVWLSTSSWIAFRLTGRMAFDYSLAARTYAFRLDTKQWDEEWIRYFGLPAGLFPDILPAGQPIGQVLPELDGIGLPPSATVAIAGHDHVAAALAVGAVRPGAVYDSMGTAETLVGTMDEGELNEAHFAAGLSFGIHVAAGRRFWMGGQPSSGGSVEWLRTILGDPPLSYEQIVSLLDEARPGPTGMLYFPYLSGSGAPQPDSRVRASFIGLEKSHGRGDMLKAVLEGTSYQLESVKRAAERLTGRSIDKLLVVGGGTRIPQWLAVKADITGCELELPGIAEASLLGAALAAAIGRGILAGAEEAVRPVGRPDGPNAAAAQATVRAPARIVPDASRHAAYLALYEQGFEPMQHPLRAFFSGSGASVGARAPH